MTLHCAHAINIQFAIDTIYSIRNQNPTFYGVCPINCCRHAMEIERSLFREATGGNPLCHLTVQGR